MTTNLTLTQLKDTYAIHRLVADDALPPEVWSTDFFSITRTVDELSLVCPTYLNLPGVLSETDWACFKIVGPLDFNMTGILAKIATTLAQAEISIFSISTYDTDYILVKTDRVAEARAALTAAGYQFE